MHFLIPVPTEFSFEQCFHFLQRSPKEVLHRCGENSVTKLIRVDGKDILFEVRAADNHHLEIQVLNTTLSKLSQQTLELYIREWFDLDTDLKLFYALVEKDKLLGPLIKRFHGYRIVGQPDLFESLVWAVLGQQINLSFAYTLKQRFVEQFGQSIKTESHQHYLFPQPNVVAQLSIESLLALQFSRQKAAYSIGIAKAFEDGVVSKEKLKGMPLVEAKEKLMTLKGVGNWTANYALMKTFRYPDAFPLEDAGIHQAIKSLKNLKTKPTLDQVKRIFKKYKGWEAYATLYLWKSL